jgi:triosephosphate isomerase
MHGNLSENDRLLKQLRGAYERDAKGAVASEVGVCVPFPYLAQAAAALTGSAISWGAQNLSTQQQGAFTGEVAGDMLADFGCRWVLVGHSERRLLQGESDQCVADKARAALAAGLIPVVCVGETLDEREAGQTLAVIRRQLAPIFALDAKALGKLTLAYEPVWAIGTGRSASPEQAQAVHADIRTALAERGASHVRVLYGGSVKPDNAATLFAKPDIDGALVGGAALIAEDFWRIVCA